MKKIFVFHCIFGIILVSISWLLFSPYISETGAVKRKIRLGEEELEKLQQFSRHSAELEKKLSLFQEDIQHLARYLPKQEELDSLSRQLRSKAMDCGLKIFEGSFDHSFSFEGLNSQDTTAFYLEVIPFQIRVEGQFSDIYRYLECLEQLPYFFGIDTLEIIQKQKKDVPAPSVQLNMNIHIISLAQKGKTFLNSLPREDETSYQPARLSSSLITAQKNLRIRAWGKNIFGQEQSKPGDEYVADANKSGNGDPQKILSHDFNLNGIVSYQGNYMALVNNQRLKKGDVLGDMEVRWISKDSVCLARGTEKIILSLNK